MYTHGPLGDRETVLRAYFGVVMLLVSLTGCAARAADDGDVEVDPWEGFNRKVFAFNDTLDRYAARPAARTWRKVTPDWFDESVTRVFENIKDLSSAVNSTLQWEWPQAGQSFGRFTVNSTLGVAGLFDVASRIKLRKSEQDFGLTLAHWGVASGPYLVMPFTGPGTVRSHAGRVPDYWFWAPNYIDDELTSYGVSAVYLVDMRAGLLDLEKAIVGDRYTFMRDVWLQNRFQKTGEAPPGDDFGDGFDDDFGDGDDGW